MTKLKNRKGFTLVELIVVIAVLALLAVGAVLAIAGIQRNARMTTNRNAANELATAFNRHNAIALYADRVTAPDAVDGNSWEFVHEPLIADADSVTIAVAFSTEDRMDQVLDWITFEANAMIWSIYEGANFDTPAA